MPQSKAKHKALLDDVDVARWNRNLAKGSVIVADIYLRSLGRFCDHIKMTPKGFAKLSIKKMEDITQDFIDGLETVKRSGESPYSPSYIASNLKSIRSWAVHNGKFFRRKIKISNPNRRPTLKDERAPTNDELKKVLYNDKTALRTRASISLIAFSGVRIEVLGNYLGSDGLRVKDLPELQIDQDGKVSFDNIPTMIVVREELSKSRRQYLTFLCREGTDILSQSLERRIEEGETIGLESGIIATSPSQAARSARFRIDDRSSFLRTTKVSNAIREAMRVVGLPWRPYVFRTYFDTVLMLAESKGLISHTYQQFWMGHSGDMEAQYTTNKRRLPKDVIEDMRGKYGKVQEYLQTYKTATASEEKIKRAFREQLLMVAGFKENEISGIDLDQMGDEQLQRMIRERLLGLMTNNGSKQKVVPIDAVEGYITQGYDYVGTLPKNRAIIKVPY